VFRDLTPINKINLLSLLLFGLRLKDSGDKFVFMKSKKILLSSLAMIVAAAAIMTIAQSSYAAETNTAGNNTSTSVNRQHNKLVSWMKGKANKTKDNDVVRQQKQAAVLAALDANDYNAWVKAVGTSSPMLSKINQNNFPQYVQAYNLRKQADAILVSLGLNQGNWKGGMMGLQANNK
jgi:hypothetical protein